MLQKKKKDGVGMCEFVYLWKKRMIKKLRQDINQKKKKRYKPKVNLDKRFSGMFLYYSFKFHQVSLKL